jgi:hypothetical protein
MCAIRLLVLLSFLYPICAFFSQTAVKKDEFQVIKSREFRPDLVRYDDFQVELINLEAPSPNGDSYRSFLMRQKIASKTYSNNQSQPRKFEKNNRNVPEPIINGEGFIPTRRLSNGSVQTLIAGIPSDNTCAISKDGIVLIGVNSHIFAYDTKTNQAVFETHSIPLNEVYSSVPTLGSFFDPKVLYDPKDDRFILTFLRGSTAASSKVIMCFSSSNNPADPWYVYELPGNPLDNNRWTDFPCLSITTDKVYYTANLIIPNVSWQEGFDGSIIWEMDKKAAYVGAADIQATLYHDIKFNNRLVRNLHPVNGADGIAHELILLSNRNFDVINDTIFFLRMVNGNLDIQALKTNLPYGVPPNARQSDTDLSDPTTGLQTNDARVLAAILFDDELQFVANSINPETGLSAIYHGTISWSDGYEVKGALISDEIKDFAYPNIAWSGNENCDREVIINFLYSAPTVFPGSAVVYMDNDRNYSEVKIIKEGENIVDRLPGGYERWGDYTGLQRRFENPGAVYSFTYHTLSNKLNSGFGVEIQSPDSSALIVNLELTDSPGICGKSLIANVQGGVAPYTYFWNGSSEPGNSIFGTFCLNETITCTVLDARGCLKTAIFSGDADIPGVNLTIFPNPVSEQFIALFQLESKAVVEANLYDSAGNLIKELLIKEAAAGMNQLSFTTESLAQGVYYVVIFANGKKIHQDKIIKG